MTKRLITIISLTTLLASLGAFAEGTGTRGGGDLCEDRIKIVRDDIKSWITKDGPKGLALPMGLSVGQYSNAMLDAIESAHVKCVGVGDSGYPVQVDGVAKVCRFDKNLAESQITCDYEKFQAMNESSQYILVHHEYAGVAGLEMPNGSDSNYDISNQLSEYLVDEVVKKLAIKPANMLVCKAKLGSGSDEVDYTATFTLGTNHAVWTQSKGGQIYLTATLDCAHNGCKKQDHGQLKAVSFLDYGFGSWGAEFVDMTGIVGGIGHPEYPELQSCQLRN